MRTRTGGVHSLRASRRRTVEPVARCTPRPSFHKANTARTGSRPARTTNSCIRSGDKDPWRKCQNFWDRFSRRGGTCRLHAMYMNQTCPICGFQEKLSSPEALLAEAFHFVRDELYLFAPVLSLGAMFSPWYRSRKPTPCHLEGLRLRLEGLRLRRAQLCVSQPSRPYFLCFYSLRARAALCRSARSLP
jgi:hypothetical protein